MNELFQEGGPLASFTELNKAILELKEEDLNDNSINFIVNEIKAIFNSKIKQIAVDSLITSFATQGLSIEVVQGVIAQLKEEAIKYFKEQNPTEKQQEIFDQVVQVFFDMLDAALDQYEGYAFTLPIQLEDGAQIPTYAHESDAAADIYAAETITLEPHSLSNKIKTGLRIALPDGYFAAILPRSSIGAKTSLRLSNSLGVIDSHYRGEIGILYDNLSGNPYTITKGDRIAQMLILPVNYFKAKVVEKVEETERNDGGFGSTGK